MRTFLFFTTMILSFELQAQVLCIQCYDQNARVKTDTNNLILNSGFENTTCTIPDSSFCPNSLKYNCDILNWTCTGGGIYSTPYVTDTVTSSYNKSIIIEGTKAAYFGNGYSNCCSSQGDDISCINLMGCEVTGFPVGYPNNWSTFGGQAGVSLEQTVNGLTPGSIYILEFWAGGDWVFPPPYFNLEGLFAVDIGFGNIFLRDRVSPRDTGIGRRFVITFAATLTSHTIRFVSWGQIGNDGGILASATLVLDDVHLFEANTGNPCQVAVNEFPQNGIASVFPNPATNRITISTNTGEESEIIFYDITSRKLLQQKFVQSLSLNITDFSKGIYLYEIRNENGRISDGKIVKD